MHNELVSSRLFQAKDFSKALDHKEETGAVMRRWTHPSLGVVYEVIYVPFAMPQKQGEVWLAFEQSCSWCGVVHEGGPERCEQ